jgi:hypothetical protein
MTSTILGPANHGTSGVVAYVLSGADGSSKDSAPLTINFYAIPINLD